MKTVTGIDWTLVVNFDNHGSLWGVDTVEDAERVIDWERVSGARIDEWHVADRKGLPIRIVRIADPEFLDTICVFPAECPDCGSPVTTLAWVSDEHHPKCSHRDPNF
ncbi:hypothetical protein [Streptomyces canus]|uniref:hypothetical protein n=1 Tax=Streptomyces canus TaxID=58343 RepID=UPI0027844128|nr:hypothetical protein [Streptomyces canus]MDQ0758712.1 hypothetical protein [Streptomyces canus]